MDHRPQLVQFVLHLDVHLAELVARYGVLIYAILFAIVFCETGLVVTPFLPGDSLLFAAGALAARRQHGPVGARRGPDRRGGPRQHVELLDRALPRPRVFQWENSRWFNRRALDEAHAFYEKYGPVALTIARFMPIVRTFAPFVAGVAAMRHATFQLYSVLGGVLWVAASSRSATSSATSPSSRRNLALRDDRRHRRVAAAARWAAFARSGAVVSAS